MTSRSLPALARALERSDLLPLVDCAAATLEVAEIDGVRHSVYSWACEERRNAGRSCRSVTVAFNQVLRGEATCSDRECVQHFTSGYGGSVMVTDALALLALADLVRSAHRFAGDPAKTTVAGKANKLRDSLQAARMTLTQVSGRGGPHQGLVAEICGRIRDDIEGAEAALLRTSCSPELREKVAARVRDELVPHRFRGVVTLEGAPVLAGIVGHTRVARKVEEVIEAFTGAGSAVPGPWLRGDPGAVEASRSGGR